MTATPRASVVVRTFNSAQTVEATFRSLREQDVPVEIVVVDSGSSDGTLALAERWADRVVRLTAEEFGFGRALNLGAEAASAPVHVALSSHSALPRPDWVRRAVEHVEQGAVAACGAYSGPDGRTLGAPLRATAADLRSNQYWGFTNHASAWSADAWRDERFDEQLTATEDKEWSWRAVSGDRYLVVDPALVVPGDHRRDRGVRSYFRRLVKEQTSVAHLRPVPAYGPASAARDLGRPVGEVPYLSGSRPWGRTRAVEVAARWRSSVVGAEMRRGDLTSAARRPVLATFHSGGDPTWDAVVDTMQPHASLACWCWAFVRSARGRQAVVVRGTTAWSEKYRDFLGVVLLHITGNRARVVVSDATIDVGSAALEQRLPAPLRPLVQSASRLLVRAVDSRRTVWCVLSSDEVRSFRSTWRLPTRAAVVLTHFSHTLDLEEWGPRAHDGGYLFSGGDSLRDYDALVDAVRHVDVPVRVATRRPVPDLPPNVEAGPTDHRTFVELLAGCSALVLPLTTASRSTGQQTYLNAMALGKPVVVTDAPGVRDYIDDGVTGIVADAAPGGLGRAVERLLALSPSERRSLGEAARDAVVSTRSPEAYRERLLEVAGVSGRLA